MLYYKREIEVVGIVLKTGRFPSSFKEVGMFGLIVVVVAFAFIFGGKKAANTVLKAVAGLIVALIAGTFNLLTAVVRGIFRLPQARPAARRLERHHDDDDED